MISSVIVGAGKGTRFKGVIPKVFYKLNDKKIIEYSLEAFQKIDKINEIILVLPYEYINSGKCKKLKRNFSKLKCIIPGGKFREESVYNGLFNCSVQNKIVLIHDGARPLISRSLIEKVINNTKKYGACIPCYEIFGSIKTIRNNFLEKTLGNDKFFIAQTPQGFNKGLLLSLMDKIKHVFGEFQDESSILRHFGYSVRTIIGEPENIKITTKEDMKIAEKMLFASFNSKNRLVEINTNGKRKYMLS